MNFFEILGRILGNSGYANISWQQAVMLLISFVLLYLAIVKQFEPLLLLPIAYGIFMSNLPNSGTFYYFYNGEVEHWYEAGILGVMYMGVKSSFFPCMMFLAVGAMTDFGPLIANPISLCLGAAAQLGIYCAFMFANAIGLFTPQQAAAIGVIGGADGPTAIYCANNLAPELVAPIAVAAYSYMALIPLIQPPIMMALTTDKERHVKMTQLRKVTKTEKIIFPVMVACLVSLLLPDVAPLLGMLMLGNLFRESGVVERLSDVAQNALCNICTIPDVAPLLGMLMLGNLFRESGVVERLSDVAQNALCNICTIFLGLSVGATARGELFLKPQTLAIVVMGLCAFALSTVGGLLLGKLLYVITGGKINPLIGSAGVSAVPMAARVSQTVGAKVDRTNFLLMHAMGPNVAGVIGSAVAAGFFLTFFKH